MAKAAYTSKSKPPRKAAAGRLTRQAATGMPVSKPKALAASGEHVHRVLKRQRQSDKVELRVTPVAKARLQAAAAAARQTLSAFLLDSGLERADTVLADRTLFLLDDKTWNAFVAALDAPTRPKPRLKRLLSEPSVVD